MRLSDVFDNPKLYELFQFGVARSGTSRRIRDEVLRPSGIQNVLDFGCGIGYHSLEFPEAQYVGIEPLEGCVQKAEIMYPAQNRKFLVGDHRTLKTLTDSSFDLIIAIGVLHHIDDETFSEFMFQGQRLLRPGGRMTTFDPVYHNAQSKISRWVVGRDRGRWVRTQPEYQTVIEKYFTNKVEAKIYSKLLRIPYDHIAFNVTKET
jgi:cyclopropane fatty-acyl-phospholipid synthase-like methyltransferase